MGDFGGKRAVEVDLKSKTGLSINENAPKLNHYKRNYNRVFFLNERRPSYSPEYLFVTANPQLTCEDQHLNGNAINLYCFCM